MGLGWADQLGAGGLLLALLLQRAEHNGKYRRAWGEELDQLLLQVQWEHVVCQEWSQRSAVQC